MWRGLGVAPVGDDDIARIHMFGAHLEVPERESHDVAAKPLSVARNRVGGTGRKFAKHGESFDELGELLEMFVQETIQTGAGG